jgi:hypothetical protein
MWGSCCPRSLLEYERDLRHLTGRLADLHHSLVVFLNGVPPRPHQTGSRDVALDSSNHRSEFSLSNS